MNNYNIRTITDTERNALRDAFVNFVVNENAKEIGLINVKDRFIQAPDSPIGQDDFFVLLERLLRKNRYKYYGRENGVFKTEGNIDEARSVSYIEMLER